MAPVSLEVPHSLKRTATDAGHHEPAPSKRRVHHSIRWQQDTAGLSIATSQDDELIQSLLSRSIVLALEAVGFERADPVAIESFRAEVEECRLRRLSTIIPVENTNGFRHGTLPYERPEVDAFLSKNSGDSARFSLRS